jgi:WD domain, G-beta repeat
VADGPSSPETPIARPLSPARRGDELLPELSDHPRYYVLEVIIMRKETCTLVAIMLSLSGCGKQEPAGSAAVRPPEAAKTKSSEAKNPLARLATREGATLEGVNAKVYAVAFSPDGKTLASGAYKKILLWDLGTGKQIGVLQGHDDQVAALAFSPDGKMLVSSGGDPVHADYWNMKFWDVENKQDKATIANSGPISTLSFTPDGKTVCGNWKGRCWDSETRIKQPPLIGLRRFGNEARDYINYAYSAGGDCVGASGVAPGQTFAAVVEIPSRKQLVDIPEFAGKLAGVSRAAKTILCKEDSTEKPSLWDFSGKKRLVLEGKLLTWDTGVAFSPNGNYLAASMEDTQFKGVLQVWDVATGKPLVTLNGESEFLSAAFSKDGELLAAGDDRGKIKVWRVDAIVK